MIKKDFAQSQHQRQKILKDHVPTSFCKHGASTYIKNLISKAPLNTAEQNQNT